MYRNDRIAGSLPQVIRFEEGMPHIADYLQQKSKLPARAQAAVVDASDRLRNCIWVDLEAKERAKNSVLALLHSMNNDLTTQAELHAKDVSAACNYNTGVKAVRLLESRGGEVKLFGVVENWKTRLEIQGQGFDWILTLIEESDKPVPPEFLENLSVLKQNRIVPDSLYLASPYGEVNPSLKEVVSSDVVKSYVKIKEVATQRIKPLGKIAEFVREIREMPDPLLLCGFGKGPIYLVQIGKWE